MTHFDLGLNVNASAKAVEPPDLGLGVTRPSNTINAFHAHANTLSGSEETIIKELVQADAVLPNGRDRRIVLEIFIAKRSSAGGGTNIWLSLPLTHVAAGIHLRKDAVVTCLFSLFTL
jgi:hypothetical protein